MNQLYPELESYHKFFLRVSELHELYVEESGNPHGTPVVFLHGGPGGAIRPKYRQFFNPKKYRVIAFDQRGCGQSLPQGAVQENTTQNLLADIEELREYLELERWHVFGGSWGSCLTLLYAETYPERVLSLNVRGIFTGRKHEIDWLYGGGVEKLFPENWEQLRALFPKAKPAEISQLINQTFLGSERKLQQKLALLLNKIDHDTAKVLPEPEEPVTDMTACINGYRILAHYVANNCFLPEGKILADAHKLNPIPGVIIQGRLDATCPLETAWELHKNWSTAAWEVVPDAGHSSSEAGITDKLIEYTDRFAAITS